MTAMAELLTELQAAGVILAAEGDRLRFHPKDKVTPELLARLRDCKAELLAMFGTGNSGNGYETPSTPEGNGGCVAVASVASPGDDYARREREAIVWCETGPAAEVDAALWEAIGWFRANGDAGQDPDLTAALATLPLADLAHYRARLSARRDAGEPDPGIEWRALVDVRVDRGHWPVAPTPTTAPRPRSAAPVAVEWPGAAADFVLLLTPDDVPHPPFRLNDWTEVRDAGKMLRWLRADITRGPGGPQALSGALQADLLELQRFALQAAETGPRIRQDERKRATLTNESDDAPMRQTSV